MKVKILEIILSSISGGAELRISVSHIQDNLLGRELFITGREKSYWFKTIEITETKDILELVDSDSQLWKRSIEFIRQEISDSEFYFTDDNK